LKVDLNPMAARRRVKKKGACDVADEPVVEGGLFSTRISRRGLMKTGAIVGGTIWVAPVIDSFMSRAAAASSQHYCCCCSNPNPNSGAVAHQCEADGIPTTAAACITYCQSIIVPGTTTHAGYQNYQWCGPASTGWNTSSGACTGATGQCTTGPVPTAAG
jgi:hypothetical protein